MAQFKKKRKRVRRVRQPQPEKPEQEGNSEQKEVGKSEGKVEKSGQKVGNSHDLGKSHPSKPSNHSSPHPSSIANPSSNANANAHANASALDGLQELEELEDGDRGSRSARSLASRGLIDAEEAAERQLGFAKARAKEEVKNRELRGESRGEEPVEDGVLSDWLLRARRVVLGKRRNSPEEMAKRIALERENEKVETGKEESDVDRVNEFCKRFKSVMAEQEREKQIRETEKQTRETEKPQEKEPNDPQTQQTQTIGETVETEETPTETESKPPSSNQPMASELQKSEEKSESESESEEMGDFFEQPRLGRGLGDALKYLRAQKVEDVEEEAYGRRNDTMIRSSNEESRDGVLQRNRRIYAGTPR